MAPSLEVDMLVNAILLVGWYILWLKMHVVRVVDDSVHVGVGTDKGRVDCRDDGLAVGAGTPPPPTDRLVTVSVEKKG